MSSLAGRVCVPCPSPAGWQFGGGKVQAPPKLRPAKPSITFTEEGGAMSAATQPRVSSRQLAEATENRRVSVGLSLKGLCWFQGQVVRRGAWKEEEELGLALPGAGVYISAFHTLSILGEGETLFLTSKLPSGR